MRTCRAFSVNNVERTEAKQPRSADLLAECVGVGVGVGVTWDGL